MKKNPIFPSDLPLMTTINNYNYELSNGRMITGWYAKPDNPRAVLQILHGMMEHSERYKAFAEWMAGQGIAVYAADLPGHGLSAVNEEDLGHLDTGRGGRRAAGCA